MIYRGPTSLDQVLRDVSLLDAAPETIAAEVFPATGHFVFPTPGINPLALVQSYREGGYLADAKKELEETLTRASVAASATKQLTDPQRRFLADVYSELAGVTAELGQAADVVQACRKAMRLDPNNPARKVSLAVAFANHGDRVKASEQGIETWDDATVCGVV